MIVVSGNTPPLDGIIEVRRVTPRDKRLVDFVDGTVLREFDLDLADTQLLFLIQEDMDVLIDAMVYDHVKDAWDAKGKRIMNVGDPVEAQDAVTLAFVKKYIQGGGGGGGGSDPGGSDPGGGGDPGGPLPPINIDIDKIKEQILKEILSQLADIKEEIQSNLDEAAKRIAEGLERLKQHNADVFRWAGIQIDEANGTATIAGLEDLKTSTGHRFNDVYQQLNAQEALIKLKASNIEVEDIKTRINKAELDISGAKADIKLKASQTAVDGAIQRLNKAEVDINGLDAALKLKANKAELDGVNERLSAAEIFIDANGGNLQGIVYDFRGIKKSLEELAAAGITNAEGLLNANAWRRTDIAHAKTELNAKIDETNTAVARQKTELLASIGETAAAADRELKAVANGLSAETTARELLAVQVGENKAAIATEASVRADETGKLNAKYGLRLDVGGKVTGFIANNDGKQGNFDIYTDKFHIYSPDASRNANPFHYDSYTGKLKLNQIEVDGALIKDASIGSAKIGTASIGSAHIQSGSITNAHLSNVTITDSMLRSVTIDGAKIRNATIDTAQIRAGAVTHVDSASGQGKYYAGDSGWNPQGGYGTVSRGGAQVLPLSYTSAPSIVVITNVVCQVSGCGIRLIMSHASGRKEIELQDHTTIGKLYTITFMTAGRYYNSSNGVKLEFYGTGMRGTSNPAYSTVWFGNWDAVALHYKR